MKRHATESFFTKSSRSGHLYIWLFVNDCFWRISVKYIKDIHREKAPSNKTPVLTKSIMNMDISVVGTPN